MNGLFSVFLLFLDKAAACKRLIMKRKSKTFLCP